jgi:hypothetical protein
MLGLEVVNYWIDKYPDIIDTRFSKEFILEGLRIVLENNHFHFDNEFYLKLWELKLLLHMQL